MPKRGAEEYITKEHGTIKNTGSGEEKPSMSTAAQQARRKIAQPKSRLGRSTTPTSTTGFGQQAQSSPFAFPTASNTTSSFPPSQHQSFNFSVPGTSTSFTFGGSTNNAQPASNPFANLNGGTNNAQPASNPFANLNGGINGANPAPQGDAMMETSPEANKTTNLFGPTTSQPAPSTNGFSFQFGQSAQQPSQPATGGFQWGQQKTQDQGSSVGTGLFGQISASQPIPSPLQFSKQKTQEQDSSAGSALFAQKLTSQPQTNGFSFGQSTQPTSAPSLFGQSTTQTSAPSLFGQSATAGAPAFNFDNASTSASAASASAPTTSAPTFSFGNTSTSASDTPAPAMFGHSTTQPSAPSLFGQSATTSAPTFSFGNTSTSTSDKPAAAPTFDFGGTSAAPPANGSLFGGASPAEQSSSVEESSTSGQKSASLASNAGFTPFKFGQPNEEPVMPRTTHDEVTLPEKKKLFTGSSTPSTMAKSAGVSFENSPSSGPSESVQLKGLEQSAAPSEPVQPKVPEQSATPSEATDRAVSTEGPPQIPRFLNAGRYKLYDENWRLKGLNKRFKQMIARCDPEKNDFLNLIQNYLDHREASGAPGLMGLDRQKVEPVAGSKRRAIDVDDMQDVTDQNKRSKPEPAPASAFGNVSQQKPASAPSNLFGSVASPKPATTFSPSRPASDPTTSNLFKSMIPGATSSPSTPNFSFGGSSAPKSTTPPASPPKPAAPQLPKFEVPKFGGNAGTNFSNAFAQAAAANAKKFEQQAKEKRKAEDFDSDEDDEEAWNKKYEEEQRAKKAKIEAAAKSLAVPGFAPSAESSRSNSPFNFGSAPAKSIERSVSPAAPTTTGSSKDAAISIESDGDQDTGSGDSGNSGDDEHEQEQAPDGLPEDQANASDDDQEEEEGEPIPDIAPENSLFSRVEKPKSAEKEEPTLFQPAANNSFKPGVMFGNIGRSTPEAPIFSPFTPATAPKGDFVPAKTFNFTPTAPAGSSVFGANLKDGPVPGEGLFGSRSGTPQPPATSDAKDTKRTSLFGASTSFGSSDNTWKAGSPIKFGSSPSDKKDDSAPSVEVTAATPPAKDQSRPFAGLFGQSNSSSAANGGSSLGFNFGNPSNTSDKPAPGFLSAANHLKGGGSGLSSGVSSRGSSPGVTSEAESVTTDTEQTYDDPQASFMNANAGEENEDVLYESKAALSRMYKDSELTEEDREKKGIQPGWRKMGAGTSKVLRDRENGKARILVRAEPGANILMNTRLLPGAKYTSQQIGRNGAVTFPVAVEGGMQLWMVKVKTKEDAERLAKIMEENKAT